MPIFTAYSPYHNDLISELLSQLYSQIESLESLLSQSKRPQFIQEVSMLKHHLCSIDNSYLYTTLSHSTLWYTLRARIAPLLKQYYLLPMDTTNSDCIELIESKSNEVQLMNLQKQSTILCIHPGTHLLTANALAKQYSTIQIICTFESSHQAYEARNNLTSDRIRIICGTFEAVDLSPVNYIYIPNITPDKQAKLSSLPSRRRSGCGIFIQHATNFSSLCYYPLDLWNTKHYIHIDTQISNRASSLRELRTVRLL